MLDLMVIYIRLSFYLLALSICPGINFFSTFLEITHKVLTNVQF